MPSGRRETPHDCDTRCPGYSPSRLLPGHECSRLPRQARLSGSRRPGRKAEAAAADLVTSPWECRSCDGGGGAHRPRAVSARTRNAGSPSQPWRTHQGRVCGARSGRVPRDRRRSGARRLSDSCGNRQSMHSALRMSASQRRSRAEVLRHALRFDWRGRCRPTSRHRYKPSGGP